MSIEKEFVPYQESLELKELGFDEQCFSFYDREGRLYESEGYYKRGDNVYEHEVIAPTFSQAFRWFREKYGLHGIPQEWTLDNFSYQIKSNREGALTIKVYGGYPLNFNTHEEAELACLKKLIQIVKEEQ